MEQDCDNKPLLMIYSKCCYKFVPKTITSTDILKHLKDFGEESNLHVIGIDCKLSNIGVPILASTLTCLFNMSVATACISDDWKLAQATPIYKSKVCKTVIIDPFCDMSCC